MRSFRAALLGVPLVLLASACGDDGVKASDYAGTWLVTSMTAGTPAVTLTRDGTPRSLRADVVITATGDTTATLVERQLVLEGGVPAGEPARVDMTVALEGDRWVLTGDDGVIVFTAMKHGDALMLTLDPDDARTTAADPPDELMMMPATAWTTACVGNWNLVSMTLGTTVIPAGTCTPVGGSFAQLQMNVAFDEALLFTRFTRLTTYGDASCNLQLDLRSSSQVGLAEEEGGAALRMFAIEGDAAELLTFAIATAGDTMTLTRTACLPLPGCETDAPTTVVVARP